MRRVSLALLGALAAAFLPQAPKRALRPLAAKTATKKKKGKKATGGFGAPKAKAPPDPKAKEAKALRAAAQECASALRAERGSDGEAQAWLKYGAVLLRGGEYAEAERVFAAGAAACPGADPMLDAALLTLRGHSASYHRGPCGAWDPASAAFDEYVVEPLEAHRSVKWGPADRARAYASTGPLLPPDECAEAIRIAEAVAAKNGGWLTARHAQAATTDMNMKDIPELLEWFNGRLESTLFPMLAARYPDKIRSPDLVRAHDAFIVKYDATTPEGQRSLPLHLDESAFSFTIALNDRCEYEGGGTRFETCRRPGDDEDDWRELVLNADAGGVVAFPGKARHGGFPISGGTRYIIPLFCFVDENESGKSPGYALEGVQ